MGLAASALFLWASGIGFIGLNCLSAGFCEDADKRTYISGTGWAV